MLSTSLFYLDFISITWTSYKTRTNLLIFKFQVFPYFILLPAALLKFFTRTTCSSNPSIYSIISIYVIIGISRLRGTGNKNICGIYSTISTMFIL